MGIHLLPPLFKQVIDVNKPTIDTIYYPDANNTTGWVENGSGGTWAFIHDAANATTSNGGSGMIVTLHKGGPGRWWNLGRGIANFNCAGLTGTVKSGKVSLAWQSGQLPPGWTGEHRAGIYGFTPANPRLVALSDFNKFGSTLLSDTLFTIPGVANSWYDFPLNAAGLAYLKNGSVCMGVRHYSDGVNLEPSGAVDYAILHMVWYGVSGGALKPKLTVTTYV